MIPGSDLGECVRGGLLTGIWATIGNVMQV